MPTRNSSRTRSRELLACLGIAAACSLACAQAQGPSRYRLLNSGDDWYVSGKDRVLDDARTHYPEFFDVIFDRNTTRVPSLLALRNDLERVPVARRNYDALNAVAIAYFETNDRAETGRGDGFDYLALSQRSAKLLAVPWRAYAETDEPLLRSAILDFLEDAGSGNKRNTERTAPRLTAIVGSLAKKETDPMRLTRIDRLTRNLQTKSDRLEARQQETQFPLD